MTIIPSELSKIPKAIRLPKRRCNHQAEPILGFYLKRQRIPLVAGDNGLEQCQRGELQFALEMAETVAHQYSINLFQNTVTSLGIT